MNLVLITPPFEHDRSYGGGVFRRGMLPPLGVGYLASMAKKHGHQVSFIDAPLMGYSIEKTVEVVKEVNANVVGISVLTKTMTSAYMLSKALKKKDPSLPIVMGGAHITSFYENVFDQCPDVDYLIPGEGEISLAELLDCLECGNNPESVAGLLLKRPEGGYYATPEREYVKDLDILPHPLRSIYENRLYIPLPNQSRRLPATTVITSRGCPYGKCRFCYQGGKYSSPYRHRSPENVINEIQQLIGKLKIREIAFWDDNFCVNKKWVYKFCDLLDENKIHISWSVFARVNSVSEELLKRMSKSGCYNIYFGFESGSQENLDFMKKGITLDESRKAVRFARKAGMDVRGSFIFAIPGDTPTKAEETIRFACELNVDWLVFYPYQVQPGTWLGNIAPEYGTVLEQDVDSLVPSYIPRAYESKEEIENLLKSANRRYYLRASFILNVLWRMRNPHTFKNILFAFIFWLNITYKSN